MAKGRTKEKEKEKRGEKKKRASRIHAAASVIRTGLREDAGKIWGGLG